MTGPVPPSGRGRSGMSSGPPGSAPGPWPAGPPTTRLPPLRPDGVHTDGSAHAGRPGVPGASHGDGPYDDRTGPLPGGQPVPPSAGLPPRPSGPWSKLTRRDGDAASDDTVGAPLDAPTVAQPAVDPHADEDRTGGLDVLRAGGPDAGRRRGRRSRAVEDEHPGDSHHALFAGDHHDDHHDDHDHHDDDDHDDDHDDGAWSGRRTRTGRRRGPLANVLALLVLVALVAGIVFGGRALIGLVNPAAEDFAGEGTGTVQVRVGEGDTLSDIAGTLVGAGVIASSPPFVEAAASEPAATGIQPGVYVLRAQMSGEAALDLLLDPATRQVSRVTVPEGFTLAATLQRISEATDLPIEELQAAAADPAALGLPAYAEGQLEGFLFPATYDVEPGDTAADVLGAMVSRFTTTAAGMQLEQRAAAAGRSVRDVVVVASMVQSETRLDEERPDVAQVIYNRLAQGIPLGIDATLAYGLDKNGNDLTVTDLQSDNPYNTRRVAGLPPSPISAPGEASLQGALAPTTGDLLYYVLESQDGRHFFTASYDEFLGARARCASAGLGCGG